MYSDTDSRKPDIHATQRRLELLNFHIVRYDGLRATLANRASILISADTLLLTALGLLFTKGIPHGHHIMEIVVVILTLALASNILWSVYLALNAIVTSSHTLFGDFPKRFLYSHHDTFDAYKDRTVQEFINESLTLTEDRLLESASAELWRQIQRQYLRYGFFRRALDKFFISALAYPFVAFLILFPW
jgi:hypothetical protein